jgi:hypothetical protein
MVTDLDIMVAIGNVSVTDGNMEFKNYKGN